MLACMRTPTRVILAAGDPAKEQETHGLGSLLVRRGCLVPVRKAFPYLMCGDSEWEINKEAAEAEVGVGTSVEGGGGGCVVYQCPDDDGGGVGCFGEVAAFSKYGRGGASGGLWWIRTTARLVDA